MKSTIVLNGFVLGFLVLGLQSCGVENREDASNTVQVVQENGFSFDEKHIFDIKQVKEVLAYANQTRIDAGKQFFHDAEALMKKHKANQSLVLYSKSIVAHPSPEAYFGLGNANLELGEYEDAIDAYHMAEWLDYEPMSHIYYNLASAYSNDYTDLDGMNRSVKYLKLALESGYDDRQHFMTNNKLKDYRYSEEYLDLFLKYFSNKDNVQRNQALFEVFVNLFPRHELPFEIGVGDMNREVEEDRLLVSKRFYTFVNQRADKFIQVSTTTKVFYHILVEETDNYIAVIYEREPKGTKHSNSNRKRSSYDIATFNKSGKLIDRLRFADCINPSYFLEGRVNADYSIEISQYKNYWSQSPKTEEEREIEHSRLIQSNSFVINNNGKFSTIDRPLLSAL